MQLALGLIETKGLVGAIEAADAMAKAADVKIISKEKITAALVTIKITGEVAAVRSALDAGAAAAQRVGQLVAVHIIPRPDDQLDSIITEDYSKVQDTSSVEPDEEQNSNSDPDEGPLDSESSYESGDLENGEVEQIELNQINLNEIENLSVHKLRRLARGLKDFPIKGRDISAANRQVLIDYFLTLKNKPF